MARPETSRAELIDQLRRLGLPPGEAVVAHTAFSRVGPVAGGPLGLIDALRAVLGPAGTLMMPSMTDDDDHPFEPAVTPCYGMGVVAETFRRLPGVLRSDSPHAFAAAGPLAAELTAPHPIDLPHGPDSPIGRLHDRDGWVLLLGVGHDADTTIHLAEWLAGVRYRRHKSVTITGAGGRWERIEYDEIDHCCEHFARVDGWLDEAGRQRRGPVGHGDARLVRARDVVQTVVPRLRTDETALLHAPGACEQCDEARSAIPRD
ncbi:MAG TPA: AAC(3) family N-acetyltransferase [Pseudomonadales bacterium]